MFKDMDVPQMHHREEPLAERLEIRPVAKRARDDGHHLATVAQVSRRQEHEACVEIGGLDPRLAQGRTMFRARIDLAVGWVEDCVTEARIGLSRAVEQVRLPIQPVTEDEIFFDEATVGVDSNTSTLLFQLGRAYRGDSPTASGRLRSIQTQRNAA